MRRRQFMPLLGGAAMAWPRAGLAQPMDRTAKVGMLMGYPENDPEGTVRAGALVQELERLGWSIGRNLQIEYRWATGDSRQFAAMAKELVQLQPDLLISHATPSTLALTRETRTIPIVFVTVSDPIGDGYVASMARPGGNVTGFANYEPALGGKWVELFKEMVPRLARMAILFNPETAPGQGRYFNSAIEAAAARFGVTTFPAPARNDADIESVFSALAHEPDAGLIATADLFVAVNRQIIVALADRFRVPAIYPFRFFVAIGGLMSYGIERSICFAGRRPMSIEFCAVPSRATCPCRGRSSSSCSSTARPPARSD
jgi:ABC-type uncharacterized transport system substrate-binding protein